MHPECRCRITDSAALVLRAAVQFRISVSAIGIRLAAWCRISDGLPRPAAARRGCAGPGRANGSRCAPVRPPLNGGFEFSYSARASGLPDVAVFVPQTVLHRAETSVNATRQGGLSEHHPKKLFRERAQAGGRLESSGFPSVSSGMDSRHDRLRTSRNSWILNWNADRMATLHPRPVRPPDRRQCQSRRRSRASASTTAAPSGELIPRASAPPPLPR
jgi:hypothetical protein